MNKVKSVWINELSWEDINNYLKKESIVILPVGSTEEHGLAGPLGLDSYAAIALAEDVGKKTGVLVAPPLWYGDSSHHLGFAGTMSLKTSTLISVIEDISESLARNGVKKILIINGHKSANLPALLSAVKNLHEYKLPKVFFAVADPMKIAKGIASKIKDNIEHHVGELEVSHVWYKYPHLIKKDKLTKKGINYEKIFSQYSQYDLFGKSGEVIDIPWNSYEQKAFAPDGSFSDSSKASPEKGKKYHDYMVNVLVNFISWLKKYKGPIGNIRSL
ncbi:creatinine amidohydrolase [Candidatus Roizmanbacteria bacterium CG22_combo_CG10-13_8_21_14_all_35_9]|uniref:Creatinine amidohydrolase n=1 Tax=Candidatus Roizmanbacteria bacterium CG22_combo_CG10-13_8_21_14_all_35_9 TaxID=1974861 RepID=A0A2H0C143_9BACT|nr:MAG: creatinine amidohydrolase [Candidatus Roizmanbacteria bacterium CG22_combo_CG10-13_8_21_14_all_35_9]